MSFEFQVSDENSILTFEKKLAVITMFLILWKKTLAGNFQWISCPSRFIRNFSSPVLFFPSESGRLLLVFMEWIRKHFWIEGIPIVKTLSFKKQFESFREKNVPVALHVTNIWSFKVYSARIPLSCTTSPLITLQNLLKRRNCTATIKNQLHG